MKVTKIVSNTVKKQDTRFEKFMHNKTEKPLPPSPVDTFKKSKN